MSHFCFWIYEKYSCCFPTFKVSCRWSLWCWDCLITSVHVRGEYVPQTSSAGCQGNSPESLCVFARVGEPKYLHLKETRLNLSFSLLKIDPPLTARTWGTGRWRGTSLTPPSFLLFSVDILSSKERSVIIFIFIVCFLSGAEQWWSLVPVQEPRTVCTTQDGMWRKQGGRGRTTPPKALN